MRTAIADFLDRVVKFDIPGCGHGHSTVLMASAFERSRFVGFDMHEASLETARANADAAGVAERSTSSAPTPAPIRARTTT